MGTFVMPAVYNYSISPNRHCWHIGRPYVSPAHQRRNKYRKPQGKEHRQNVHLRNKARPHDCIFTHWICDQTFANYSQSVASGEVVIRDERRHSLLLEFKQLNIEKQQTARVCNS